MGCEIGGRGEENAVFKVWKEAMFVTGSANDKTAGVFGVGKIATIRNHVRWAAGLFAPWMGQRRRG